jgi:hypothetical protein
VSERAGHPVIGRDQTPPTRHQVPVVWSALPSRKSCEQIRIPARSDFTEVFLVYTVCSTGAMDVLFYMYLDIYLIPLDLMPSRERKCFFNNQPQVFITNYSFTV